MTPARRCDALLLALIVLPACRGLTSFGLLGENFPPHDIAFASYTEPEFPFRLRATPIADGRAVVAVTVGDDGRIADAVAVEASHPAFVEAIFEVAGQWVLLPDESPTTPRRELLHFEFRRSGVARSVSHREAARAPFDAIEDGQPVIRTVPAAVLMPDRADSRTDDTLPAPGAGVSGAVDVSFVIDADGRVRVPVVAAGTDDALAEAALLLVSGWRFEPPRIDGRPVLVEVARTLNFAPAGR